MEIPIGTAKDISDKFDWPVVIIMAADNNGKQHVTIYGQSKMDSDNAATAGNRLKKFLGWPESLCTAKPVDRICGNCSYFQEPNPVDKMFDGSGECMAEPVQVMRDKSDRACRIFEGKDWR